MEGDLQNIDLFYEAGIRMRPLWEAICSGCWSGPFPKIDIPASANRYYSDLYRAPIATHQADAEFFREENAINKPEKYFSTEEHFDVGFRIQIITTPGHSAGSIFYLINGRLFSGDTLFNGAIGRTWGASEAEEQKKRKN